MLPTVANAIIVVSVIQTKADFVITVISVEDVAPFVDASVDFIVSVVVVQNLSNLVILIFCYLAQLTAGMGKTESQLSTMATR